MGGYAASMFPWNFLLPMAAAYVLLPFTVYFFFCRYCSIPFECTKYICYMLLSMFVSAGKIWYSMEGSTGLLMEILLLMCCGHFLLKRKWMEALSVSVLILSVLNVSEGIMSWTDYRIMMPLILKHKDWIFWSDAVREFLKVPLVWGLSSFILYRFRHVLIQTNRRTLLWLTFPVFFISMVLRTIQTSFYGKDIEMDGTTGEFFPLIKIDHTELLFLQLFACVCLLVTLSAYEEILKIFRTEQNVRLLKQQTAEQEVYMQEALLREQKTRALRHDMKNHLTVLAELLKAGEIDQASEYLTCLEAVAAELVSPVQTGIPAADALLGSKFSLAEQEGIQISCSLRLPADSIVRPVDWCILLANGIDNAIGACKKVPAEKRQIFITSRKKGAFFLLVIENSCHPDIQKAPEDGTGLANIRAVMKRYQGTAENTAGGGNYCLKLLFGSLQQKPDLLHPSDNSGEYSADITEEARKHPNKQTGGIIYGNKCRRLWLTGHRCRGFLWRREQSKAPGPGTETSASGTTEKGSGPE